METEAQYKVIYFRGRVRCRLRLMFASTLDARFITEQGHKVDPALLYQDNQLSVRLMENGSTNAERTRHIANRINSKELTVAYCPTENMITDLLTKPLQGEQFRRLRRQLLNWDEITTKIRKTL